MLVIHVGDKCWRSNVTLGIITSTIVKSPRQCEQVCHLSRSLLSSWSCSKQCRHFHHIFLTSCWRKDFFHPWPHHPKHCTDDFADVWLHFLLAYHILKIWCMQYANVCVHCVHCVCVCVHCAHCVCTLCTPSDNYPPALPKSFAVSCLAWSPSSVASDRSWTTRLANGNRPFPGEYWMTSVTFVIFSPRSK